MWAMCVCKCKCASVGMTAQNKWTHTHLSANDLCSLHYSPLETISPSPSGFLSPRSRPPRCEGRTKATEQLFVLSERILMEEKFVKNKHWFRHQTRFRRHRIFHCTIFNPTQGHSASHVKRTVGVLWTSLENPQIFLDCCGYVLFEYWSQ